MQLRQWVGVAVATLVGVLAAAPGADLRAVAQRGTASGQARAEIELRLRQAERRLGQGDTVGALLDVEAALARDDAYWRAYLVRGQIQARMGDDLGARDSLTRAAELDPGNPHLHFLVASVALQLADFEAAARQLAAAAESGYDARAVDALAARLRDDLPQPLDLDAVRAAPRISVPGDPELEAGDDPEREALVRELRTSMLDARQVALVRDPVRARWVVTLERDPARAPPVRLTLRDRESGALLLEAGVTSAGAQARLEIADLAVRILEMIAVPPPDGESAEAADQKSNESRKWANVSAPASIPSRSAIS